MDIDYVDSNDKVIGHGPIGKAYAEGQIVRISRIFIQNGQGELLIQKRSDNHKSMPGRWDQSAAGHVDKAESYDEAASRELAEEMGISGVELQPLVRYYSEETDDAKYVKKRFNMLYCGKYDGQVSVDPEEVSDYKWIALPELEEWAGKSPDDFTEGFLKALEKYKDL